jgi:hypothetical protein
VFKAMCTLRGAGCRVKLQWQQLQAKVQVNWTGASGLLLHL